MSDSGLKVFVGANFEVEGQDIINENSAFLKRDDIFFDERHNFVSHAVTPSNWDWYINYLKFVQVIARKNPSAKPNYLLDLGYVPVVYLPTCFMELSANMFNALDRINLPYIKIAPTNFLNKYLNIQGFDGWVSKMDAAKYLSCAPEEVTSIDLVRRVFINGGK